MKPTLADLIAQTPGAQKRTQALDTLKARRTALLASTAHPADQIEPLPILDAPDDFAKRFFARLQENDAVLRGSKPRLVVDNDKPYAPDDQD